MAERNETRTITTYTCDLCGSEEEVSSEYAVSVRRLRVITLDPTDDNGFPVAEADRTEPAVDVCGWCFGTGRKSGHAVKGKMLRDVAELIAKRKAEAAAQPAEPDQRTVQQRLLTAAWPMRTGVRLS